MVNVPIGEVLKEYNYINDDQLNQALEFQKRDRKKRLGQILIELGFVTETQVIEALGKRLNLPVINVVAFPVEIEAVSKIPKDLAVRYNMIGIKVENGTLSVAMSDPLNFYAIEDIRQLTRMNLSIYLAESQSILDLINYYYSEIDVQRAAKHVHSTVLSTQVEVTSAEEAESTNLAPVVRLLDSLLSKGYSTNASDIHIEPFEERTLIRFRVDGMLVDYMNLTHQIQNPLIARIKILANLNIAEKRVPQDGHFRTVVEGNEINVRVSIIPTIHGEKAVMRFLLTDTPIDNKEQFGMNKTNYDKFMQMLMSPHGIIYITGPTGSGKTTTLYMALDYLSKGEVNISTIEDPVERNLERVNQMQVNNMAGLTFDVGLRAILRQDPDIIMVGETRDTETAQISVRAAITGHLVLSTLHTNDALSAIVRLNDMGVSPYLIANSVTGLVAQRLIRKICPYCMLTYKPELAERKLLDDDIVEVRKGKGCHVCNNTGYKGRIGIDEVAVIDRTLRTLISRNAPMEEIKAYAIKEQGMMTLKESAMELVRKGITSTQELIKISYYQ
ncbi:MAG: type II/IV secretion system protein [Clostridiaceae bacterium]|nr:type II/IV secretion system protein [Clostridiaceae bacterium]